MRMIPDSRNYVISRRSKTTYSSISARQALPQDGNNLKRPTEIIGVPKSLGVLDRFPLSLGNRSDGIWRDPGIFARGDLGADRRGVRS